MEHQAQDNFENLKFALAVLGKGNINDIEYVLGQSVSDFLQLVEADPQIDSQEGLLTLDNVTADTLLKTVEENDFLHFLAVHEKAIQLIIENFNQNQAIDNICFHQLFNRYAEQLINQTPQKLIELVAQVTQIPLQEGMGQDCLLYHGIAQRNLGHYVESIDLLGQLVEMPSVVDETLGRALNARAICYSLLGKLPAALVDYHNSLTIWQRTQNSVQEGMVRLNIGIIAYECQHYGVAEENLLLAAKILEEYQSYTWLASAQYELGLLYRDQGEWELALEYFEYCIERRRQEAAEDRIAIALSSIGEVQMLQGKFNLARSTLLKALNKMETTSFQIDLLLRLGLLAQATKNDRDAHSYYSQALSLTEEQEGSYMFPMVHYRMGSLFVTSSQSNTAVTHWQTGIEWIEENRADLQQEGMKIGLLGKWQQLYESLVLLFIDHGNFEQALYFVEKARARAFLDMFGQSNEQLSMEKDEILTVPQLQNCLSDDEVIVEFFITGQPGGYHNMLEKIPKKANSLKGFLLATEKVLVFIVTKDAVRCIKLGVTVSTIVSRQFHRISGQLRGIPPLPGKPMRPMRSWEQLREQLFTPLESYLLGKSHIYIVPHNVLHYLPLHILRNGTVQVVPHATVSYGPSASVLLSRHHESTDTEQPRILALGVNADDLTQAEAEASWIGQRLDGDTLLGNEATQLKICEALPHYNIIHFSCHGYFRKRAPMQSALQLADGELTAATLLQSVKLKADLVVLSACDTGLNDLHPGDELMGLTRAFLGCGARSLLATLWPVHEIPTRIFMEIFYETWFSGTTKAAAVLAAQQVLRGLEVDELGARLKQYGLDQITMADTLSLFQSMVRGKCPFDHPYYWGGFILIGAPD